MPRITIREQDWTSPGLPADYTSYAVLIAGFTGKDQQGNSRLDSVFSATADESSDNDNIAKPDPNGVYEFNSADKFYSTIGLVEDPAVTSDKDISINDKIIDVSIEHYGNQMAYELLNMGYTVFYKPLRDITDIKKMTEDSFWNIFRDKANYDFRFVTHGLLSETTNSDVTESLDDERAKIESIASDLGTIATKAEEAAAAEGETKTKDELADELYKDYLDDNSENGEFTHKDLLPEFDPDNISGAFDAAVSSIEGQKDLCNKKRSYFMTVDDINKVNKCIAKLATYTDSIGDNANTGRGDCIALIELAEDEYIKTDSESKTPEALIISGINSIGIDEASGKFCALTVPSVYYKKAKNETVKFPGAFHYLACFINSLKAGYREWYAAAGYTRGISSFLVDHTSVKLGEIAINALEPRNKRNENDTEPKFACNVIANFRGSYYLWGNRTADPLGLSSSMDKGDLVASSFLNIRQLCITIKKQLQVASRMFTFDPNNDTLWVNFVNVIRPTLEQMKADQGIKDYKIIKENPDKKATLKAVIRIVPIEAVEDFDLMVSLEDSFGEVVVTE